MRKLKALDEWSDKFESVKTMPDKEADNIISKSCQNIVDEFTTNPQALKKQADVIVLSAAKAVTEENYLKNAEMSIEDDYDSIDGIINNGNKQQEYEKLKEPEKKSEEQHLYREIRLSKMQTLLLIMSNKRMIKPKLRGKNYKAILDLCHSGTGLFLRGE